MQAQLCCGQPRLVLPSTARQKHAWALRNQRDCCLSHRQLHRFLKATDEKSTETAVSGTESTTRTMNPFGSFEDDTPADSFCIIEGREALQDFATLQLSEIKDNIQGRRNRIFLLMEEVRRLRIQQRLKGGDMPKEAEVAEEKYLSALPFLPDLTEKNLNTYYTVYSGFVLAIILFGGILAPVLEVKLGVGGTSYREFVESVHLPSQLASVDPIVASFCGGAVGVLTALLVVEINNVKKQQHNRCHYCEGTGYLMCGNCVGAGMESGSGNSCAFCAGTGKVMCTGCLCTGKSMATEHDPRIDPFV